MQTPVKDEDHEGLVPEMWRPTLAAIVDSLVCGDELLATDLPDVDPVSPELTRHCREAVQGYGPVTFVPLPESAWETSVCVWWGDHWRCLIDLWTEEEGRSDLVVEVP